MEKLKTLYENVKNRWKELKKHQQIVIIAVALLVMGGLITLSFWSSSEDYVLLDKNLSEDDMKYTKEALVRLGVDFDVREENSLWVPANMENKLRMELALLGLPKQDNVYDDIFGQKSLGGDTIFDRTVKEQEAQRRMIRSAIESLNPVQLAIVNITPLDESVFIRGEKPAKAVVQLKLYPGMKLTEKQVQGINKIVTCSVKGLDEQNVTILDNDGNILELDKGETEIDESIWRLEYQRKQARELKQKIIDVLSPTVGAGGVRAEVTVECDFDEMEQTDETYLSEGSAILHESTEDETKQGMQQQLALPPGTASNVTNAANLQQGNQPISSTKNTSEIDYQPSKTVTRIKHVPGKIKRITASVTIDNLKIPDKKGEIKSTPWTPIQITQLEDIVKNAVGFDMKRGDTVSVVNLPFDTTKIDLAEKEIKEAEKWQRYMTFFKAAAIAAVGLMLLYLIRSVFNALRIGEEVVPVALGPGTGPLVIEGDEEERALLGADTAGVLPGEVGEEEEEVELSEEEKIENEILEFVDEAPELIANILQNWLKEDSPKSAVRR